MAEGKNTLFENIVKEVFGTTDIPDISTLMPNDKASRDMLNQLTEDEKKSCYFDFRKSKHDISITYDNNIKLLMAESDLKEGLIKTYAITDKMIADLMRYFHLSIKNFELTRDKNNRPWGLNILIPAIEENVENIKKAMKFYGYFLSKKDDIKENTWVKLNFEPKFQPQIYLQSNILYHWTTSRHLNKIFNIGLCPRSTNTFLKYPDRVYLIDSQNMDEIMRKGHTLYSKEKSKDNCLNNSSDYFDKKGIRHMEYALLKIDADKIKKMVSFHKAYNYSNSVYTADNIPPGVIEIEKYQMFPLENIPILETVDYLSVLYNKSIQK